MLQLRDSWRNCPRDGKRMVIDPLHEEGQAIVTHRCIHCDYSERAPGELPQRTAPTFLAGLRRRLWEATP